MVKDILPELLKKIKYEFENNVLKNKSTIKLLTSVGAGKATYKEANEYAQIIGESLAKAFQDNISSEILPDGKVYYNIADRLLNDTLKENHDLVTDYVEKVQRSLNEKANIGIKPITPDINQDRINGLVDKISSDEFEKTKWLLDEPIVNFTQSIVDDAIKVNADFHSKSGLSPNIIRKSTGKCCKWCDNLAGVYDYDDVKDTGNNVFRRHRHCRCTVEFDPRNGSKRKNVHTHKDSGSKEDREARIAQAQKWKSEDENKKISAKEKRQIEVSKHTFSESVSKIEQNDRINDLKSEVESQSYKIPSKKLKSKLQSKSDEWVQSLTENESIDIGCYTGTGYIEINRRLRSGLMNEETLNKVKNIDEALKKFRLDDDVRFFRGVSTAEVKALERGETLKGFTSLTASKQVATNFYEVINAKKGEVVIFNVPKGTKGAFLGDGSGYKLEEEFLLGRNAKISAKRINGILEVTIHEN